MTATKTGKSAAAKEPVSRERLRLLAYRTTGLLDLGFDLSQTLRLANRNDVVHDAQALLERGCPHEFVVNELTD